MSCTCKRFKPLRYFTLEEFLSSDTAKKKGIENLPSFEVVCNLYELAVVLDDIRELWKKPIMVTSGFRCPALNKSVGGVNNSAHLTGASDLQSGDDNDKFYEFILNYLQENDIPFDECIKERDNNTEWTHLALKSINGEQRGKIKTIIKK